MSKDDWHQREELSSGIDSVDCLSWRCLNGCRFFICISLGGGENDEVWKWRRRLFAWEEEVVGELRLLLQTVTLEVNKEDMWLWNLETSNAFSVRSAYIFLTAQPIVTL
ncbi:hypothetical protein MTR_7g029185 [Medicago truncatula]|uniref:Uncharacterized protein n=1 Tax=Medicago truncatula TaxID=3880 RepID=A0A072TYU6_MEDTR|nr:hypothetical protein MTR_7g029185 [Medicago truncatula]